MVSTGSAEDNWETAMPLFVRTYGQVSTLDPVTGQLLGNVNVTALGMSLDLTQVATAAHVAGQGPSYFTSLFNGSMVAFVASGGSSSSSSVRIAWMWAPTNMAFHAAFGSAFTAYGASYLNTSNVQPQPASRAPIACTRCNDGVLSTLLCFTTAATSQRKCRVVHLSPQEGQQCCVQPASPKNLIGYPQATSLITRSAQKNATRITIVAMEDRSLFGVDMDSGKALFATTYGNKSRLPRIRLVGGVSEDGKYFAYSLTDVSITNGWESEELLVVREIITGAVLSSTLVNKSLLLKGFGAWTPRGIVFTVFDTRINKHGAILFSKEGVVLHETPVNFWLHRKLIFSNSGLVIIAGSNTSAATPQNPMYSLAAFNTSNLKLEWTAGVTPYDATSSATTWVIGLPMVFEVSPQKVKAVGIPIWNDEMVNYAAASGDATKRTMVTNITTFLL